MSRKVIISQIAEKRLEILFEYLLDAWSYKVKTDFINKLDENIQIIKNQPESFPESEKECGLRKCVITKLECLPLLVQIYRVHKNYIYLWSHSILIIEMYFLMVTIFRKMENQRVMIKQIIKGRNMV